MLKEEVEGVWRMIDGRGLDSLCGGEEGKEMEREVRYLRKGGTRLMCSWKGDEILQYKGGIWRQGSSVKRHGA